MRDKIIRAVAQGAFFLSIGFLMIIGFRLGELVWPEPENVIIHKLQPQQCEKNGIAGEQQ